MVGIGLAIEGFYLLVSRVSVQLDGFNERAVRFQVKDRHSRFPCIVLQRQEQTPSQPKATRSWGYPHALPPKGQQPPDRWGGEFLRLWRKAPGWDETPLKGVGQFGEILLNAPSG